MKLHLVIGLVVVMSVAFILFFFRVLFDEGRIFIEVNNRSSRSISVLPVWDDGIAAYYERIWISPGAQESVCLPNVEHLILVIYDAKKSVPIGSLPLAGYKVKDRRAFIEFPPKQGMRKVSVVEQGIYHEQCKLEKSRLLRKKGSRRFKPVGPVGLG